jgi:hypothetical protein
MDELFRELAYEETAMILITTLYLAEQPPGSLKDAPWLIDMHFKEKVVTFISAMQYSAGHQDASMLSNLHEQLRIQMAVLQALDKLLYFLTEGDDPEDSPSDLGFIEDLKREIDDLGTDNNPVVQYAVQTCHDWIESQYEDF